MAKSKFCITLEKKGDDIANVSVEVNASANDIANMFNMLSEQNQEVIPPILAGIFFNESENRTLN